MESNPSLSAAFQLFDEANSADPNQEEWQGQQYPKELLYAQRMTERLAVFAPDASPVLQLAARSQHICRWEIPRSDFPMTRTGYNQWRSQLRLFHAEKAGQLLRSLDFNTALIDRVQFLILKKRLKRDPETQTLEDVICLVFLEHYMDNFMQKYEDEKMIGILRKTWAKMSERGHEAALQLPLSERAIDLVKKALNNG